MDITLTPSEKLGLEARYKKERDGRIKDRLKAIFLNEEVLTQRQIAQALRI